MKYLLWEIYGNASGDTEAEKAWYEALEKNEVLYQQARKKLPKKFVKIFEQEDRFHDTGIMRYEMYTEKKRKKYALNIKMELDFYSGNYQNGFLIFKDVSSFTFNGSEDTSQMLYNSLSEESLAEWTYSEIYHEDGNIVFNIMFVGGVELNIKCSDVDIKTIKSEK